MKSWRPFSSFASRPNFRSNPPSRLFRPIVSESHHFANHSSQRSNYLDPNQPFDNPNARFAPKFIRRPSSILRFRAPPIPLCFRCRSRGHTAKNCHLPLRCYICAISGHKSFRCPRFSVTQKTSILDSGKSIEDSSLSLLQRSDPEDRVDVMMIDPYVLSCYPLDEYLSGDSNDVCSSHRQIPAENTMALNEEPALGPYSSVDDPVNSETQDQTCLDLNPVPRKIFDGLVIIDDFEDYYSEDEDVNHGSITTSFTEKSNGSAENPRKNGKAVFRPMDFRKFIMYCCIQAVDGFNRFVRAQARGSTRMSPFRSRKEIKKSCYIECLRDSSIPPRTEDPIRLFKPEIAVKKKSAVKPFRGLVPSGSVRRSPRLNKGPV